MGGGNGFEAPNLGVIGTFTTIHDVIPPVLIESVPANFKQSREGEPFQLPLDIIWRFDENVGEVSGKCMIKVEKDVLKEWSVRGGLIANDCSANEVCVTITELPVSLPDEQLVSCGFKAHDADSNPVKIQEKFIN